MWAGQGAVLRGCGPDVEVRNHFSRRLRRLQALLLYRKLLASPGRVFVSTAGRADLLLLSWAAREAIPPEKVFLFFHWVRPKPGKAEDFRKVAARHPRLVVLGPTPAVAEVFLQAGFRDVRVVPYPITSRGEAARTGRDGEGFRHLLYAGAARQDKGFSHVVDLVAHLASLRAEIPVTVQASPDHYDRTDPQTKADLVRLASAGYPHLRVCRETLDAAAYADLFRGAICLQPYRRDDFADRISGVMLDAFSAGAPVVTVSETWMARTVERFDAGAVLEAISPAGMLDAVESVRKEYPRFRENALRAGRALQEEHDAGRLFDALTASAIERASP